MSGDNVNRILAYQTAVDEAMRIPSSNCWIVDFELALAFHGLKLIPINNMRPIKEYHVQSPRPPEDQLAGWVDSYIVEHDLDDDRQSVLWGSNPVKHQP